MFFDFFFTKCGVWAHIKKQLLLFSFHLAIMYKIDSVY